MVHDTGGRAHGPADLGRLPSAHAPAGRTGAGVESARRRENQRSRTGEGGNRKGARARGRAAYCGRASPRAGGTGTGDRRSSGGKAQDPRCGEITFFRQRLS